MPAESRCEIWGWGCGCGGEEVRERKVASAMGERPGRGESVAGVFLRFGEGRGGVLQMLPRQTNRIEIGGEGCGVEGLAILLLFFEG